MPVLLIAGLLGGIYFFMPSEYDKLMQEALIKKNENPTVTVFDDFPEPPMPDRNENEKTILGIDIDKNGIRDDVDIWINRTGKNYNERMALRQMARAEQFRLEVCDLNKYDKSSFACQKPADALVCMKTFYQEKSSDYKEKIWNLTYSSRFRKNCLKFYEKNNCSFSFDLYKKEKACEFNLKR